MSRMQPFLYKEAVAVEGHTARVGWDIAGFFGLPFPATTLGIGFYSATVLFLRAERTGLYDSLLVIIYSTGLNSYSWS